MIKNINKKSILTILFCMLIYGCAAECAATDVHVGGAEGRQVVIVDSNTGQTVGRRETDANGNVSVPCGQSVGIGQTR